MNFYLNLIDKQLKKEHDNQSIGIILCRDKKGTPVEFALKGMTSPLGVSEYTLTGTLPKELKNVLPSAWKVIY